MPEKAAYISVRLGLALALGLALGPTGCAKKEPEGETLRTTAPINNNAPEAKNAPVAPRDPSIIMPGGVSKGAKK